MTIFRRLLFLIALMFWQGGFMFYGAVVVPVGTHVLHSHTQQGFITRSVTNYLNAAGVVAVLVWGWNIVAEPGASKRVRWLSWILWGVVVLLLGFQFWLHGQMDELLDMRHFRVLDGSHFGFLHSGYLIASTLQWAASMVLLGLNLRAWQQQV